jgi:hypothetical protein
MVGPDVTSEVASTFEKLQFREIYMGFWWQNLNETGHSEHPGG